MRDDKYVLISIFVGVESESNRDSRSSVYAKDSIDAYKDAAKTHKEASKTPKDAARKDNAFLRARESLSKLNR